MNIGIYAGTFDPIHKGHIEFAKSALQQAGLDRIIIVAEKEPYRKRPHASWDHRQAMIERATQELDFIDHDYAFANELSHQHTMHDMLTKASSHYGKDSTVWFLVGSDVFEHVGGWRQVVHKDRYAGFAIALKDNHTSDWLEAKLRNLKEHGFDINTSLVNHADSHASSSTVRSAIAAGTSLPQEALERVTEYIQKHQLYR